MSLELPGIFLAGLLTFLSPCVLPLVPLYLSFLAGVSLQQLREAGAGVRRPWGAAVGFSLGLSSVFVVLGLAASAVGGALAEHRVALLRFGGVALLLLGLKQLGVLRVPWLDREARPWLGRVRRGGSALGAFLFGGAFALGWTPCIGPVLGAVLTYTAASTSSPAQGALYLATYAAGLSVPLLAVAAAAPLALRWLDRARRHLHTFERVTGALLVALAVLLFTDSLGLLVPEAPAAPTAAAPATLAPSQALACTQGPGEEGGCALPDEPLGFTPSSASAPLLEQVERPTLVEFVSTTCPVCERMAPRVVELERACAGRGVDVVRVDVGTPEGRQAAARHHIRGVPTFVFLDGFGHEVTRRVGEQPVAVLREGLESLAGMRCERGPEAGGQAQEMREN